PENPAALDEPGDLPNTQGVVLDPIVALRHRIRLARGQSVTVDAVFVAADNKAAAETLIERYHDPRLADPVFETAWTHSQVLLHELRASDADADLFETMAGSLIYANPRNRAAPSVLARNQRGQNALWSYGISGDWPIVLARISDTHGLNLIRQ